MRDTRGRRDPIESRRLRLTSAIGSCRAPSRRFHGRSSNGLGPSSIPHDPSRGRLSRDVPRPSYGSSPRFRGVPPPCYERPWACAFSLVRVATRFERLAAGIVPNVAELAFGEPRRASAAVRLLEHAKYF